MNVCFGYWKYTRSREPSSAFHGTMTTRFDNWKTYLMFNFVIEKLQILLKPHGASWTHVIDILLSHSKKEKVHASSDLLRSWIKRWSCMKCCLIACKQTTLETIKKTASVQWTTFEANCSELPAIKSSAGACGAAKSSLKLEWAGWWSFWAAKIIKSQENINIASFRVSQSLRFSKLLLLIKI